MTAAADTSFLAEGGSGWTLPWSLLMSCAFLTVLVGFVRRWRNGKGSQADNLPDELRPVKRVEDIPHVYHFGKWVPTWVEGLYTCHIIKRDGIQNLFASPFVHKYKTMFKIAFLWDNVIQVQDIDLVQKLLGSSDPVILDKARFIYDFMFTGALRQGLIASDYDIWVPHRRVTQKAFTYKALPLYVDAMNRHSRRFVTDFYDGIGPDDLYDLLSSCTVKIIAEILLGPGSSCVTQSDTMHRCVQLLKGIKRWRVLHRPITLIPPIWWLHFKTRWAFDDAEKTVYDMVNNDVDLARKKLKAEEGRPAPYKTMVEEMLEAKAQPNEILDECVTFLMAGHETLASILNFFLQLMAENKGIQEELQREIDTVFEKKGDNYLTLEDLTELKYLERCVFEMMRMSPATPVIFRQLTGDMQVDEFKFKKGTTFAFNSWTHHRIQPENFPDPEKFDPDRWLPDVRNARPQASFASFSLGPRNCPGQKLAVVEMKTILAHIFRNFSVSSTDKWLDVRIWCDATLFLERNYNITMHRRILKG